MKRGYLIGMELNEKICQISFYDEMEQEPRTVEVNADNYQIPLMIGRKGNEWIAGKDAQKMETIGEGSIVSDLLSHAMNHDLVQVGDKSYEGIWLLSLYIQMVLRDFQKIEAITFTIPEMDVDIMQLLKSVGQKLGVAKEYISVMDYKESFSYYMNYQPKELWQYDSTLFYCDRNEVKAFMLRKLKTGIGNGREVFATVDEVANEEIEELGAVYPVVDEEKAKEADEKLKEFFKNVFEKKMVSSVFLTGEGFENSWYPNSLQMLCSGRRVFQGNNLYSKGACYAAYNRAVDSAKSLVYLDETKIKEKICLKLRVKGIDEWHPIVSWGTHWYEDDTQFELLLEDGEDIELQVESLVKREVETVKVSLEGLPKRKNYTLRLQVNVIFMDENTCKITWKDAGFGAFFAPSEFQTETVIQLGGRNGKFNSLS